MQSYTPEDADFSRREESVRAQPEITYFMAASFSAAICPAGPLGDSF